MSPMPPMSPLVVGGRLTRGVLAPGPVVFLALVAWAAHTAGDSVLGGGAAIGLALLLALVSGEGLRRRWGAPWLATVLVGLGLAMIPAASSLIMPAWPLLSGLGLGLVGVVLGRHAVAASAADAWRGVAVGTATSAAGFGASALVTLVMGAVLGQGPAVYGSLPARVLLAADSGLAAALIHPWFIAAVVVSGLVSARVGQIVSIASLTSVLLTLLCAPLVGHALPVAPLASLVAAGLVAAGVVVLARRRPGLVVPALGLVLLLALLPWSQPLLILALGVAAGGSYAWAAQGPEDGSDLLALDALAARAMPGLWLGYLVLVASGRGLPDEAAIGTAGLVLSILRLSLIVVVVRRLIEQWTLPFADARVLPILLLVGGGWEAVGTFTLTQASGVLLIEEMVALSVALVWLGAHHRREARARQQATAPAFTVAIAAPTGAGPLAPAPPRAVLRARPFHDRWLDSQVRETTEGLQDAHARLESALAASRMQAELRLSGLEVLLARPPGDERALALALQACREWVEAPALSSAVFDAYFGAVLRLIEPRRVLRAPQEEAFRLSHRQDGWAMRLLKMLRRARHRALGPTQRTIRVGRLWRDHVGAALPIHAEAAVRDYLDALTALERDALEAVTRQLGVTPSTATTAAATAATAEAEAATATAAVKMATMGAAGRLALAQEALLHHLADGVAAAHRDFVARVARDGMIEGLSARSPRLGDARRARLALHNHLEGFSAASRARWQRVALELQLRRVSLWLEDFLRAAWSDLAQVASLPPSGPAEGLRARVGERIADCVRNAPGTKAIRRFERRVARLPDELVVSAWRGGEARSVGPEAIRVDLRAFVQAEAAREGALAVVNATRELEQALRRLRAALPDTAEPLPLPTSFSDDVAALQARLHACFATIRTDLDAVTSRRALLRERASTLQRSSSLRWLAEAVAWLRQDIVPLVQALWQDVRAALLAHDRHVQRGGVQDFAEQARSAAHVPEPYHRIFDPALLDVAGFFVPRPDVEAALSAALRPRTPGLCRSVLVMGDPGSGKTALVQHVLPSLSGVVLIDVALRRGKPLAVSLGEALGLGSAPLDAGGVRRWLAGQPEGQPHLFVVDDAEAMFERTPEGLRAAARFRDLVTETAGDASWLVLLRRPTARFLDVAIDLYDAFDQVVDVPPLDAAQLERLLMQRHETSGYPLAFSAAPAATWRGLVQRLPPWRWQLRAHVFAAFHRQTGGNPDLAQRLWLATIQATPEARQLQIRPPELPAFSLAQLLREPLRATAACLALHRALSPAELARILRISPEDAQRSVLDLERAGLAERVGSAGRWGLDPLYTAQILAQLTLEDRL